MAPGDHGRERRGYHHGNLRAALLEAARALIAEKGPMGFTIAEAARLAGVSPSAPYRHFRDRDALIVDVAREGFTRFAEALEAAWEAPSLGPLKALDRVGSAYLAFARDEPAYFSAMFESGVPVGADPELKRAADRAFHVLVRACEALRPLAPEGRRPPALMMATHIWALSHGVASLFGRGDGGRRSSPLSAEEVLESAVGIYLQGLGIIPA
ncbi:MAG: WHG domain-containing protein [Alphaproteobacteria bacterium]|nr:WHG domain-containing protein [Alphaproteobacteria bacterium]